MTRRFPLLCVGSLWLLAGLTGCSGPEVRAGRCAPGQTSATLPSGKTGCRGTPRCPGGQVWAGKRCVPVCGPDDPLAHTCCGPDKEWFFSRQKRQCCCRGGKVPSGPRCCWSGQRYSAAKGRCVGQPLCWKTPQTPMVTRDGRGCSASDQYGFHWSKPSGYAMHGVTGGRLCVWTPRRTLITLAPDGEGYPGAPVKSCPRNLEAMAMPGARFLLVRGRRRAYLTVVENGSVEAGNLSEHDGTRAERRLARMLLSKKRGRLWLVSGKARQLLQKIRAREIRDLSVSVRRAKDQAPAVLETEVRYGLALQWGTDCKSLAVHFPSLERGRTLRGSCED